jgi:TonB family protein
MLRTRRIFLSLLIATAGLRAQDPAEPVYDLGAGITPPRLVHQVQPKPDAGTKGFRISGTVLIGLIVSSQGMPVNVHVDRSVDKDIDQSAMDAVKEWRFDPARKEGKPVAVKVTVEIRFNDL